MLQEKVFDHFISVSAPDDAFIESVFAEVDLLALYWYGDHVLWCNQAIAYLVIIVLWNRSGLSLLLDAKLYPTVITTSAGATLEVGRLLIDLLDMLHWKRISIMSDLGSARIDGTFQVLMTAFKKRLAEFDILTTQFNSEDQNVRYTDALIKSGQHSRGYWIFISINFIQNFSTYWLFSL
jgi:hypothetical protein